MPDSKSNGSDSFILFELAGTTYAIRSRSVKQMEMVEQVTPVPNSHPAVEGVVFSRGQVIPVINLRTRFGFPAIPFDMRTRLIVVETGSRTVGFIVDSAREFAPIPTQTIQPPPEAISALSGRYLEGIATLGERLVLVIKIDEVLQLEELATQM